MEAKKNYNNLIQALKLAAAPFEIQTASLPNFVNVPDEIALLYYDVYLTIENLKEEGLIPQRSLIMLEHLNEIYDEMSEDKSLWTLDKMRENNSWRESRKLAATILSDLNESCDTPNLDFLNWMK